MMVDHKGQAPKCTSPAPGLARGRLSGMYLLLVPFPCSGAKMWLCICTVSSRCDLVKLLVLSRLLNFLPVKWRYNNAKITTSQ